MQCSLYKWHVKGVQLVTHLYMHVLKCCRMVQRISYHFLRYGWSWDSKIPFLGNNATIYWNRCWRQKQDSLLFGSWKVSASLFSNKYDLSLQVWKIIFRTEHILHLSFQIFVLGPLKSWKLFRPVEPFLVHLYLETEDYICLKLLVWSGSLYILRIICE